MTATKRAADTLIILVVMLLAWQALHQVVGDDRAAGSGADARLSRQVRADRAFCRKRLGDARLLFLRADLVLWDRARDRRVDGNSSTVRGGRRADPDFALHAAEGHALSGGAADLRAQPVGPGDVRRDARRAAGRAFDHERDPQYSAGLSEVGAHACTCRDGRLFSRCCSRRRCRRWSRACGSASR